MKILSNQSKKIIVCLFVVCLAGCAGMTDADWEALGAAAEAIAGATPSKSSSTRSRSSSSSTYSSNSQSTPSYSSGSTSGYSSKVHVDHVTHQCISVLREPRHPQKPNEQWLTFTNKCDFKVEIFTKGSISTEWVALAEGTLHAYQTKKKYIYYDVSKNSRFEYIACANKSRLGVNMFDDKAVRCVNSENFK